MNIKERLSELKKQADGGTPAGAPPKPTTDPGPNKKWVFNRKTMGWEARDVNDQTIYEAVGSVKEQWAHYMDDRDSLLVAAQWDPKDENSMDWTEANMLKETIAHYQEKHKGKEISVIESDWQSGNVFVEVKGFKKTQAAKEVYAKLEGECVTCPIDESKIEVAACRGAGGEACPFYLKREASELCSFKKLGASQPSTLDQYINDVNKREQVIKVASAILDKMPAPRKASTPTFTIEKDETYKPVYRLASVERLGHKGQVIKKNTDGSFKVRWENGNTGAYWAAELNAL